MFCPHCGKEISEGQAFCQHCGLRLAEPEAGISTGRIRTPWEDRENVGFSRGLLKTLKEVLFAPSDFFRKMPVTGGLTDPLLYALIIGMAGLAFFYFWETLFHDSMQHFMTRELRDMSERGMFSDRGPLATAMTPFLLILWLFVASGLLHVFLLLVRGAKAGFEATFRVVGYSLSPFVFLIIPVCGMPVTALWSITLAVIGLKEAHETSGGKAVVAILFPFLLCCGILTATIMVFMGAIAASFGSMMHWYR
jgi:hypothetical protein